MARLAALLAGVAMVAAQPISGIAAADEPALRVLPPQVVLRGNQARQRLVVHRFQGDRSVGSLEEALTWHSSDPAVAEVHQGFVVARGNGQCKLTVQVQGGATAEVEVRVERFDEPWVWSFRNHVQSVLTKAGCNSGACHGAQAGKKGFKLTLRGYDPMHDWLVLTRQARGRRIIPSDPGRSLVLTKPTGAVPHKGGVRFEIESLEYRVLAEWIAAGAPAPADDDPRIAHIEVLPKEAVLKPGDKQQLVVLAHFHDGSIEDVTHWAKYMATDQSVADVDEAGRVQIVGSGESAVSVWYLSQVATAVVAVPFANQIDPEVFARAPRRNLIDEHVLRNLEALHLEPSPPADDAPFLRRAYLDTLGVLPTAEETRRFLADDSPQKRDRLIEELLNRPEFVDYWTYKWSDLLLVNSEKLAAPAMWAYSNWIRRHVAANTPWNQLVRQLVTASGSTLENGAANFFVLHQDPQNLAETTSQALLGMSIGCARCHNHPLEKWTNDQYYGLANLFGRVRFKTAEGAGNAIVFAADSGELIQPSTGRPQPPRPLDGEPIPFDSPGDRRAVLADWLTSPENPYFTRAIVNRVWANFFNVGLVEPVDDLRLSNPASNEPLLEALCAELVAARYDLKSLMRLILQSHAYQRSSTVLPTNRDDTRFYARYYPRRLMAEVLLDAVSGVTAVPTPFPNYPAGWRALQLPDSNVQSYFLKTFGRPQRVITCECERSDEPSMTQVLHLSNGEAINDKLKTAGNRIDQLLKAGAGDEQILEDLYLSALSRYPTPRERDALLEVLRAQEAAQRRTVLEDLYWSVLTSREFLFNR